MITLINDDCYKAIKTIPDKSIDLVYIDLPYSFEQGGEGGSFGTKSCSYNAEIKMLTADVALNKVFWDDLCRIMKHTYTYIWCSKEQIYPIMKYFVEEKQCRFTILCWCKTNPVPKTNGVWLPDIEYCLVFKGEGTPKYNDGYELKSKWYISPLNKHDKDVWEHPTIKPLELVERHIKHSTNPGDTVLDCFMGSGTTGVACRNLDRNFIGIEIDKHYFEIAERRIKDQVQQTNIFD